jgi:hypothetical protein
MGLQKYNEALICPSSLHLYDEGVVQIHLMTQWRSNDQVCDPSNPLAIIYGKVM